MTKEEIEKIASDYLNDRESELDMIEVFAVAKEALEQESRIGHWINGNSTCPCCGESKFKNLDADIWADWKPKYCPNCGAKMVEPQNLKYADNDTMMPAT